MGSFPYAWIILLVELIRNPELLNPEFITWNLESQHQLETEITRNLDSKIQDCLVLTYVKEGRYDL